MILRILLPMMMAVSTVAAEPTDARDILYYPTNPLRQAGPSSSTLTAKALERQETWGEGQERWNLPTRTYMADGPSKDAYLRASKKYRQGEQLKNAEPQKAVDCFAEALSELVGLQRADGAFQPQAVSYRITRTQAQLDELLADK